MRSSLCRLVLLGVFLLSACSGDDYQNDGISPDGDQPDGDEAPADGDDGDGDDDPALIEYAPLALEASEAPFDLGEVEADYFQDVAYGDDELQTFDFFLADSAEPTPLIVYIHGGGFTGGDKEGIYDNSDEILEALENGVSFGTINYRLLADVDPDGVIKSLSDSARCLQFMRYFSETLNIDPERIALYGGSAGAGTSLWLGFHDDMADEESLDPVEWESTRVAAVGAIETQATYDLMRWTDDILAQFGITFNLVFALLPEAEQLLLSFYGIDEFEEIESEEIVAYRANVDMLALMSDDDAPMFVMNTSVDPGVPSDLNGFFHHPNHALFLKERADEVGLEYIAHIPELEIEDASETRVIPFLLDHLGVSE